MKNFRDPERDICLFKAAGERKDILIIEDDKSQQMVLDWMLKKIDSNIRVDWCDSAEEAYENLQRDDYRIVIADFMLGGFENGLNVWEYCKDHMRDCTFFLISSLRLDRFCLAEGEGEKNPQLLSKPLDLNQLSECIRNALH